MRGWCHSVCCSTGREAKRGGGEKCKKQWMEKEQKTEIKTCSEGVQAIWFSGMRWGKWFYLVILIIMSSLHCQPEDRCRLIARRCLLVLLMLTSELPSKLLSVSFAANSMINVPAHFCSALQPEACPLSMGIIGEGFIHLKRDKQTAEELPQDTFRLLWSCVFMCIAPDYVWVSGWVWFPSIFISPHTRLLT